MDLPTGIAATYESGSAAYSALDPQVRLGGHDVPLYGGDDPENLWGSPFMTVTPHDDLDLADGELHVGRTSLTEARTHLAEAERDLDASAKEIAGLSLPARSLGDAPHADALARAVDDQLDRTAELLDEGRISAGITIDGLVGAARDYDGADGGIEQWWLRRKEQVEEGVHDTGRWVRDRVEDGNELVQDRVEDVKEGAEWVADKLGLD